MAAQRPAHVAGSRSQQALPAVRRRPAAPAALAPALTALSPPIAAMLAILDRPALRSRRLRTENQRTKSQLFSSMHRIDSELASLLLLQEPLLHLALKTES